MAKKIGPNNVNPSSRGSSPTGVVPGGPGGSFKQKPLEGAAGKGLPVAMKRALTKKAPRGNATGYAGNLKPNARAAGRR